MKRSQHYKDIKAHMKWVLEHPPWCYTGKCPVQWAKAFIPTMADCASREDYEAAQATKDAIIEFLNSMGAEIPADAELVNKKAP